MTKRTLCIVAQRTTTYAYEVPMDVPDEIANDPNPMSRDVKLALWVQSNEDLWHDELMDDGRSKIGPFEDVSVKDVTGEPYVS